MVQGKTYSNKQLQKLIVPLLIEQILGILVGILDTTQAKASAICSSVLFAR